MTINGQLISLHCEVGQASGMLNDIAQYAGGIIIYANTNTTYTYGNPWISPYEFYIINDGREADSSVWNWNMKNVMWLDNYYTGTDGRFYPIRNFEYRSNPWAPNFPTWTLYY